MDSHQVWKVIIRLYGDRHPNYGINPRDIRPITRLFTDLTQLKSYLYNIAQAWGLPENINVDDWINHFFDDSIDCPTVAWTGRRYVHTIKIVKLTINQTEFTYENRGEPCLIKNLSLY